MKEELRIQTPFGKTRSPMQRKKKETVAGSSLGFKLKGCWLGYVLGFLGFRVQVEMPGPDLPSVSAHSVSWKQKAQSPGAAFASLACGGCPSHFPSLHLHIRFTRAVSAFFTQGRLFWVRVSHWTLVLFLVDWLARKLQRATCLYPPPPRPSAAAQGF